MAPVRGQCCVPPPHSDYKGVGREEVWPEERSVYLTGSPDAKSAILFVSDIYGWEVPQSRQLADKIAASGYFVVLPEYLDGDPYKVTNPDDEYDGLWPWLEKHSVEADREKIRKVLDHIRSEYSFKGVGVVAFCRGAKISIPLLPDDEAVQAAVFCHPSFITFEEINAVKVPLSIIAPEIDIVITPEENLAFGKALEESPLVSLSKVKVYKDAEHGFTTRYSDLDPPAVARAEEAHQDLLDWLHLTLPRAPEPTIGDKFQHLSTTDDDKVQV